MSFVFKTIDSPVGKLKLAASDQGLVAVVFENNEKPNGARRSELVESPTNPILLDAERQLGEYFAGKRRNFSIALDMRGTPFQKGVWEALRAIPFGETRSYGDVARQLGNPRATRAVGAANGRNPIPIVVPCHRVIGSTGKLTGFGGGIETKARLLELEANISDGGSRHGRLLRESARKFAEMKKPATHHVANLAALQLHLKFSPRSKM